MKHSLHDFSARLWCAPAGNIPARAQEIILVERLRAPLPNGGAGRIPLPTCRAGAILPALPITAARRFPPVKRLFYAPLVPCSFEPGGTQAGQLLSMKSSCIQHPASESLLIIRQWQIEATGTTCAAALLSFFEYWHDVKLGMREKARQANAVAVSHGESGTQDASLYQFHTAEELHSGIMALYNKRSIREAILRLTEMGFISVHRNPNSRYKFDNTRHFLFYPEAVNKWLSQRTCGKKDRRENQKARPSAQKDGTIPKTTSKTSSEIPKKEKGAFAKHGLFFGEKKPLHPYPTSEEAMNETLEHHGIEPSPDYDGNFFASMQRCGWLIKGKPVYDWIATYAARLAKTTP